MKQLMTFQNFPLVVVTALIVWAWISILSVLLGSFF